MVAVGDDAAASPASAAAPPPEAGEGVDVGGRWRRGEAVVVVVAPGEAARLKG